MTSRCVRSDERGAVLVMGVVCMVVILGIAALVIDLAMLRQDRANDRKAADLIATAAATTLAEQGSTAAEACEQGWGYFLENVEDEGSSISAPACSTAFAGVCNPMVKRTAVGTAGPYTATIMYPVPDGDPWLENPDVVGAPTQAAVLSDGSPCERIGVSVDHDRKLIFGGILGVVNSSTQSRSVSLAVDDLKTDNPTALLILDPTACNVVTASGQAKIRVRPWDKEPGYITVDSDARGGTGSYSCSSGQNVALDALGTQNSAIIAEGNATSGALGVIKMYALGPNGNPARAYDTTDLAAGRVSPRPTPSSRRTGRLPGDWVYNCKAAGKDGIAGNADDCRFTDTQSPYLDLLIADLGGTGVPPGYTRYPRTDVPTDNCALNSGDPNVILPPGNWWIDCPSGLSVKNAFTFQGGSVVFQGSLTAASQGTITINDANSSSVVVYLRSGSLNKDAQAALTIKRGMVYLANGVINLGAGSGLLSWAAPTDGNFKNLALWSESSAQHTLGGQSNLQAQGVFFMPNATPFVFAGQGGQNTAQAQFITFRLEVSGQGELVLQPNPEGVLPTYGSSSVLIR